MYGIFLGMLGAPWSLVSMGVLALLDFHLMYAGLGLWRCAYRWTRPLGGGRRGHYLRESQRVLWYAQKRAIWEMICGRDSFVLDVIYASLSGTAQSSMVIMHIWY